MWGCSSALAAERTPMLCATMGWTTSGRTPIGPWAVGSMGWAYDFGAEAGEVTVEQEKFRHRRKARLRAEIVDAGLALRLDGFGGEALLDEIDYARFPPVHERESPTYGAIPVDPQRC